MVSQYIFTNIDKNNKVCDVSPYTQSYPISLNKNSLGFISFFIPLHYPLSDGEVTSIFRQTYFCVIRHWTNLL